MKIEIDKDFEVLGYSDCRYEKLTIEVQYKGEPVAQINQDMGRDKLELEIFVGLGSSSLKVPLSGFVDALILARDSISKKIEC
ncbi:MULTISPECIES: hypothetical protein [Pseudomonas]|uniref:hypothetical protein n=1 Tax=Pseudomonas TaxID=286 RepID=UPI000D6EF102|nr:hypothetical protein [Pseudomonas sp. RW407]PWU27238.1 hypothetical protein DK254_32590 [Pseudomonas sp. RW407]